MSFIRQMRERRLVQIVVAYLAGGWIALEVISQLVEQDVLPHLVYRLGLLWYLAGILAAGVVGWFHGERGEQRAPIREVVLLGVLGAAVLGFSAREAMRQYERHRAVVSAAESGLDPRRVAVLYFRDMTRGGSLQHLADGLTEGLAEELAAVRALDVVSMAGVLPFRDGTHSVETIAGALGSGTVVDGTLEQVGGDLRVSLRLFDGASGAEFRRAGLAHPASDPMGLEEDLSREVARLLREWLGEEVRLRRQERATENVRAWALVQQAEGLRKEAARHHAETAPERAGEALGRADSLLGLAERLDPEWQEPTVLRARTAYRLSRLAFDFGNDPEPILRPALAALEHAERALAVQPRDPAALEVRGTTRYWLWHMGRYRSLSPTEQERLFLDAREDLERAVELDRSRATAYVTLSHLYQNCDDRGLSAVALAAQRAYEEDAYLETAATVLNRLVEAYSGLEQFADARRWCEEGARRFPGDPAFVECQLLLMLAPGGEPDPARAGHLVLRMDSLAATADQRSWTAVWCGIMRAGILARAGRADSARAVLDRAHAEQVRIAATLDPRLDLLGLEAYVRHLLGEDERAIDLLQRYVAVNPGHSFDPAGGLHWWWSDLAHHPRYRELVALRSGER